MTDLEQQKIRLDCLSTASASAEGGINVLILANFYYQFVANGEIPEINNEKEVELPVLEETVCATLLTNKGFDRADIKIGYQQILNISVYRNIIMVGIEAWSLVRKYDKLSDLTEQWKITGEYIKEH